LGAHPNTKRSAPTRQNMANILILLIL